MTKRRTVVLGAVLVVGTLAGGSLVGMSAYAARTLTDQVLRTETWTEASVPDTVQIAPRYAAVTVREGDSFQVKTTGVWIDNVAPFKRSVLGSTYLLEPNLSSLREVQINPISDSARPEKIEVTLPRGKHVELVVSTWGGSANVSGTFKRVDLSAGSTTFAGAADTLNIWSPGMPAQITTTGVGPSGRAPKVTLDGNGNTTADFTRSGVSKLTVTPGHGPTTTTVTLPAPFDQYRVETSTDPDWDDVGTSYTNRGDVMATAVEPLKNEVGTNPAGTVPVEVFLNGGTTELVRATVPAPATPAPAAPAQ